MEPAPSDASAALSYGTWTCKYLAYAKEFRYLMLPAIRPHLVAEASVSNVTTSLDKVVLNESYGPQHAFSTKTTIDRSRLLELPAELRNDIWALVVIDENPEGIRILNFCYCLEPALLRTCSQIRAEATAIFYGGNRFLAVKPHEALPWLRQIGAERRTMVREVHVAIWVQSWMGGKMKGRSPRALSKAWLLLKHHEGIPRDEFLGQRKVKKGRTFNALTNGAVLEEWWTCKTDTDRKLLDTLPKSISTVKHLSHRTDYKEIPRFPVHREAGRVEITYEVN